MRSGFVAFAVLALVARMVAADPVAVAHAVDLRDGVALQSLKESNPAHFAAIERILAALTSEPARAEGDWLQATFDAHDIDLTRMIVKTSYPPKQLLSFQLEQVRYTMYVVRRDMVGQFEPLH